MKILVVFGSLLGKTKRVGMLIGHTIKNFNYDVSVKDVRSVINDELNNYDVVILGSSTWDDGMLQFDFREFNQSLLQSTFPNKNFAVFSLGSHKYPHPFGSAIILEKTVETVGGKLIIDSAKFDIDHDEPENKCDAQIIEWSENLVAKFKRL